MKDSLDSWYAKEAAKRNGTSSDYEMEKLGYVKGYYIGQGAWHWVKKGGKK